MRVRFRDADEWACSGGVSFPLRAPATYTPTTVITEWLTLNCAGDWAAQRRRGWLDVRFSLARDAEQARAHFESEGLWRGPPPMADGGSRTA